VPQRLLDCGACLSVHFSRNAAPHFGQIDRAYWWNPICGWFNKAPAIRRIADATLEMT
jgi:hypothetical protein